MRFVTVAATLLLASVLASFMASPALAQGEGYTTTNTDHFRFVYRRRFAPVVGDTIDIAEDTRARIIADLGASTETPVVEVRFARNVEEMRELCPRQPPSWADAVAFSPDNIIVISLTTSHHRPVSLETVFRHEMSHIVLRWIVGERGVPRWFNEGLAIVESGELSFERFQLLWPGAARGDLTPIRRLDRSFPAREFAANRAYAESADFVRFLSRYRGSWRLRELLQRTVDQHLRIAWTRLRFEGSGKDVAVISSDGRRWSYRKPFYPGRSASRIDQAISWLKQLGLCDDTGLTEDGQGYRQRNLEVLERLNEPA